jgi:hypothetical protein
MEDQKQGGVCVACGGTPIALDDKCVNCADKPAEGGEKPEGETSETPAE